MTEIPTRPASLWRRLGAFFYDSLLLLAILFLATALMMLVTRGDFNPASLPFLLYLLFWLYLLLISFWFFGWFWTHGGQTLGMRAWKIRVLQPSGTAINWSQAAQRFVVALLLGGLGMIWCLFSKDKQALYDKLAKTYVERIE